MIDHYKAAYPAIFTKLPEDIEALRHLLVIDENENDGEVDELDEVDSEDYNYIVYVTETLQQAVGDEQALITLIKRLDEVPGFEDFYPVEIDLYGIKTDLDESHIAHAILSEIEAMQS